jgi:hypothetical protein
MVSGDVVFELADEESCATCLDFGLRMFSLIPAMAVAQVWG